MEELIVKKVSIFNIKGEVAKTTSIANLGACLSQQGIVDLDPQSNLTKLFKAYSMTIYQYQMFC